MAEFAHYFRKPRKSNFSMEEVNTLVDSVKMHLGELYGRHAKRATNSSVRQRAWNDIMRRVNRVSVERRTLQEVKNKWKKCQYILKEKGLLKKLRNVDNFDEGNHDSPSEELDSMPLQERLSKTPSTSTSSPAYEKTKSHPRVLKSQQMSPTKLKVTRQSSPRVLNRQPIEAPSPSPVNEEMCLRWNSHHSNMQTAFPSILHKEQYVDVTLAAEGKTLKCHRLILSSCSPYFEEILSGLSPLQHPVLFMKDIPFWILKSLCDFMYAGEVHIYQDRLEELLAVAEALKIKGLARKSTTAEDATSRKAPEPVKAKPVPVVPANSKSLAQSKPRYQNQIFNSSVEDEGDLLDPLDLLEPMYEESTDEKMERKHSSSMVRPREVRLSNVQPIRKPIIKRVRKRKMSETCRPPSPPPVFSFRKGTRSRPNVKVPKFYHGDYSPATSKSTLHADESILDMEEIKTEPIDVVDTFIPYSDDETHAPAPPISFGVMEMTNASPIIITNAKSPLDDKFKPIKLSKPVISDVHSVRVGEDGGDAPAGGLEVIKIPLCPNNELPTTKEIVSSDREEIDKEERGEIVKNGNNDNSSSILSHLEEEAMNVANILSNVASDECVGGN